jgi:copper chaperone NosL
MRLKAGVGLMLVLIIAGCEPEVEPIMYGRDSCAYCKMTISDRNYGAELVTWKGKVFKFDAVECLLNYLREYEENYTYQMAVAYDKPSNLQTVDSLTFLISPNLPSPMGEFLTAFSSQAIAQEFQQEKEGELFNWPELKRKFELK